MTTRHTAATPGLMFASDQANSPRAAPVPGGPLSATPFGVHGVQRQVLSELPDSAPGEHSHLAGQRLQPPYPSDESAATGGASAAPDRLSIRPAPFHPQQPQQHVYGMHQPGPNGPSPQSPAFPAQRSMDNPHDSHQMQHGQRSSGRDSFCSHQDEPMHSGGSAPPPHPAPAGMPPHPHAHRYMGPHAHHHHQTMPVVYRYPPPPHGHPYHPGYPPHSRMMSPPHLRHHVLPPGYTHPRGGPGGSGGGAQPLGTMPPRPPGGMYGPPPTHPHGPYHSPYDDPIAHHAEAMRAGPGGTPGSSGMHPSAANPYGAPPPPPQQHQQSPLGPEEALDLNPYGRHSQQQQQQHGHNSSSDGGAGSMSALTPNGSSGSGTRPRPLSGQYSGGHMPPSAAPKGYPQGAGSMLPYGTPLPAYQGTTEHQAGSGMVGSPPPTVPYGRPGAPGAAPHMGGVPPQLMRRGGAGAPSGMMPLGEHRQGGGGNGGAGDVTAAGGSAIPGLPSMSPMLPPPRGGSPGVPLDVLMHMAANEPDLDPVLDRDLDLEELGLTEAHLSEDILDQAVTMASSPRHGGYTASGMPGGGHHNQHQHPSSDAEYSALMEPMDGQGSGPAAAMPMAGSVPPHARQRAPGAAGSAGGASGGSGVSEETGGAAAMGMQHQHQQQQHQHLGRGGLPGQQHSPPQTAMQQQQHPQQSAAAHGWPGAPSLDDMKFEDAGGMCMGMGEQHEEGEQEPEHMGIGHLMASEAEEDQATDSEAMDAEGNGHDGEEDAHGDGAGGSGGGSAAERAQQQGACRRGPVRSTCTRFSEDPEDKAGGLEEGLEAMSDEGMDGEEEDEEDEDEEDHADYDDDDDADADERARRKRRQVATASGMVGGKPSASGGGPSGSGGMRRARSMPEPSDLYPRQIGVRPSPEEQLEVLLAKVEAGADLELLGDIPAEVMSALLEKVGRKGKGGRAPAVDPRLDPSIDPKRAKRILANRLSAARSKLKQKLILEGLKAKYDQLVASKAAYAAELARLKKACKELEAKNKALGVSRAAGGGAGSAGAAPGQEGVAAGPGPIKTEAMAY